MIHFKKIILFFFLILFAAAVVNAQGLKAPKPDLASQVLGILNNSADGLALSQTQHEKLSQNNHAFVNDLMKIKNTVAPEADQKASFLNLKKSRTEFLMELLGAELAKKYGVNLLKSIKPLQSKLGLAALAF